MSSFAKAPIRGEGDCFEVNVELLVCNDLVSVAALVVGVTSGRMSFSNASGVK